MRTIQFIFLRVFDTVAVDELEKANPMSVLGEFLKGIVSVLTVSPPPLYRYPYRNSAESFRGDWGRIGKDIEFVFEQPEKQGGQPHDNE